MMYATEVGTTRTTYSVEKNISKPITRAQTSAEAKYAVKCHILLCLNAYGLLIYCGIKSDAVSDK